MVVIKNNLLQILVTLFFDSETLRFRSPIGILQRCVEKDYKIPGHDVVLKKDAKYETIYFPSGVPVHCCPLTQLSSNTVQRGSQHCQTRLFLVEIFAEGQRFCCAVVCQSKSLYRSRAGSYLQQSNTQLIVNIQPTVKSRVLMRVTNQKINFLSKGHST